jgi:hypothetical protein
VAAVALMTPPRKLVIPSAPREALDALCADLADGGLSVPGVTARVPVSETFATLWRHRTGDDVAREQRLA